MTSRLWALGILLAALALVSPRDTRACGALVFNEESAGSLVDQEILIASGADRTVLVISVGYSDTSTEFGFLLPIQKAPLAVYDGDPKLFTALAERTAPRVRIMQESPSQGGQSGCCAALPGAGAAAPGATSGEVEVIARGETTTYEYVVVGGSSGATLKEWLEKERFVPPAGMQTALDDYIRQKWLFLAARLKPTSLKGSLAPIEVQLPAIPVTELRYPLALSAQSVPPTKRVDVLMYLMSIGAMLPGNYEIDRIKSSELRALSATESNYQEVADKRLSTDDFLLESGANDLRADEIFHWAAKPEGTPEQSDKPPTLGQSYDKLFPVPFSLVRLHARLGPAALKDMQFKQAGSDDVKQENVFVIYHSSKVGAGTAGLLLLLALYRRRSRRSYSMPKRPLFCAKN